MFVEFGAAPIFREKFPTSLRCSVCWLTFPQPNDNDSFWYFIN